MTQMRIARPSTDLAAIERFYLDGPEPDDLVERLVAAGGTVVPSRNPYWDTWGVTIVDPDSYRLVLCTRSWSNR
ncbi:hypothetical protein EV649_0942 [Kribbella sp. VKM Ac-2569]|uniref:hypothetical protein n=1 Tax=Kribbella sp. VKM Ac-2569 TaxID=2512220 RepID=UPI00102B57BC|nr:hypothetical protein [Kribbella sp. VKM Ac-2569]RZT27188.1 hypothetical protein EV649_0942 [Kribbella sp. VKM Ac-2569]